MRSCISPIWLRKAGFVPCGKCNFCLQRRRSDWTFRITEEWKVSSSAHFITLTYAHSPVTADGEVTLCERDVQLFLKRLRKFQWKVSKGTARRLRYYYCGEYGGDGGRPHYHLILFNALDETINNLRRIWQLGIVHVGFVKPASIQYVTKYVVDMQPEGQTRVKEFSRVSLGIGKSYLTERSVKWHRSGARFFAYREGKPVPLPRYYQQKIFGRIARDKHRVQALIDVAAKYEKELVRLASLYRSVADADVRAFLATRLYDENVMMEHEKISKTIKAFKNGIR